ncbi:hypothetical protein AAFF_G00052800 [Aldrovandia affinis]|uniref:Uncharacterized protein n=1 Tax=Aldrovandia affinis TaxID=143900 RepID=A0AAD7T4S4_9TELE|nr:hypothetical protein AAFF_G00052800 [Aldrovandia affinis]
MFECFSVSTSGITSCKNFLLIQEVDPELLWTQAPFVRKNGEAPATQPGVTQMIDNTTTNDMASTNAVTPWTAITSIHCCVVVISVGPRPILPIVTATPGGRHKGQKVNRHKSVGTY